MCGCVNDLRVEQAIWKRTGMNMGTRVGEDTFKVNISSFDV